MKRILFFSLVCISSHLYAQVDLTLGLKAHYTFTGNANDISGNNYNGLTAGGIQLTTDRFGNANSAYLFDGIDDRIVVTDNGGLSTPSFSLCYFFMTESTTYQNCIGKINYNDGNAATYNSGIFPTGMKPYFGTIGTTGNCFVHVPGTLVYTIFSPTTIQVNEWNCVVNTFENGVEKIYLNGTLQSQSTTPFNNATFCTNTNFVIGSWWNNDPFRFKGKMDDIRYYDRALSLEEVTALCQTVIPVTITNFTATSVSDRHIKLSWHTAEETNIEHYSVQRSTSPSDGFNNIGSIRSNRHSNTSDYNFFDETAQPGITYYYRLGVVENGIVRKYSPTRVAKIKSAGAIEVVFTNPTNGWLQLEFISIPESPITVNLRNSIGQTIMKQFYTNVPGKIDIDMLTEPAGVYWLTVRSEKGNIVRKVVKL